MLLLQILTVVVYLIMVIVVLCGGSRTVVIWVTVIFLLIILLTDFFPCNHQQVLNFYLPMAIVFSVLIVAAILVCFSMPERFCENTRIPQLYLNSHVWFAVAYLVIFYQF